MKINNTNVITLEPNIFLIKNFLSDQECDSLVHYADSSEWLFEEKEYGVDLDLAISDKEYVDNLRSRISNLFFDQYNIEGADVIHRRFPGQTLHVHNDNNGTRPWLIWGISIYLNQFENGEIFYPNLGFEYNPNKGDLVIHPSSLDKYKIGRAHV